MYSLRNGALKLNSSTLKSISDRKQYEHFNFKVDFWFWLPLNLIISIVSSKSFLTRWLLKFLLQNTCYFESLFDCSWVQTCLENSWNWIQWNAMLCVE